MTKDILKRILINKQKPESTRDISPNELVDLILMVLNKVKGIEGVAKETSKEKKLLQRILISKNKPADLKDITPTELIDLVLVVLEKIKGIESTVQSGILKGDKGSNPVADVDFLSKQSAETILSQAVNKAKQDVDKAVKRIKSPKNGEDYQITSQDYETIAQVVHNSINLPDFSKLISQEPESIRNSLELLQGKERLSIESIKGIDVALEDVYRRVASLNVRNGSGGGKSQLFALGDVKVDGITDGQILYYQSSSKSWKPTSSPALSIANMTLDSSGFDVIKQDNLQDFAEKTDHSILKQKGTGVNTTYVATVTEGGTTFAIPAIFGEIYSDEGYSDVHYLGATGITVSDLTTNSTYVYLDKGTILRQQNTIPTREELTRNIFLIRIAINITSETITAFEYLNNPIGNYANSLRDVVDYLSAQGVPFKKDMVVTGRPSDLGFDVSAGSILKYGGTGDIFNPNIRSFASVTNATFPLLKRSSGDGGANTNLPKFWDNNDTLVAIGSTTWVGHRLYRFSSGNLALQYGQGNYANIVLAKAGVLLEDYVLNPALKNATFLGWWFIESTATGTSGTPDAEFVEYTLGIQGGVSSDLSGALLKGNNLSDVLDASEARANLAVAPLANPVFTSSIAFKIQRNTSTTTIDATAYQWNGNTDSAGFTYSLPAGVTDRTYKIANTGSSSNTLTISPNGSEHLKGANSNVTLADGETLTIGWESTDGWY